MCTLCSGVQKKILQCRTCTLVQSSWSLVRMCLVFLTKNLACAPNVGNQCACWCQQKQHWWISFLCSNKHSHHVQSWSNWEFALVDKTLSSATDSTASMCWTLCFITFLNNPEKRGTLRHFSLLVNDVILLCKVVFAHKKCNVLQCIVLSSITTKCLHAIWNLPQCMNGHKMSCSLFVNHVRAFS